MASNAEVVEQSREKLKPQEEALAQAIANAMRTCSKRFKTRHQARAKAHRSNRLSGQRRTP